MKEYTNYSKLTKRVKLEPYGAWLDITFSSDHVRKYEGEDVDEDCAGAVYKYENDRTCPEAILHVNPECANINTIAHESFHAAMYLLGRRGISAKTNNNEAVAYMVGHIAEIIGDFHQELLKRKLVQPIEE